MQNPRRTSQFTMPFAHLNDKASTRSILLVDDHPSYRAIVHTALGSFFPQCNMLEADSVAMGLRMIEANTPDVVVVDMTLPDGSAMDLVKQASHYLEQSGQIIVISSHAREELLPLINCDDIHGYVSKEEGVVALVWMIQAVTGIPSSTENLERFKNYAPNK